MTGAHIAYVLAKLNKKMFKEHRCVLYCGPSNKSVDVVFGKAVCFIFISGMIIMSLFHCRKISSLAQSRKAP